MCERILAQNCQKFDDFNLEFSMSHHNARYQSYKNAPISPLYAFHCTQPPPNNRTQVCPLPNPKPVPANRPNLEAKRPPKPLIVTSLCKLNTKSCLNQVSCGGGREEKRTNIRLRCRFRTPLLRTAPSTWFPSTWVRIKYKPFLVETHMIIFS